MEGSMTYEEVFDFMNYMREWEDFYEYVDGEPNYLLPLIKDWHSKHKHNDDRRTGTQTERRNIG